MKFDFKVSDEAYNRPSRARNNLGRSRTARVFVQSNATKIIDEWFNSNSVYALDFKCKTWAKLGRLAHKVNRIAITEALGVQSRDVVWSRYCGCTCPCSPGYNVQTHKYGGKGIWMNIEASEEELAPIRDYFKIADLELKVEIAEHRNK